MNGKDVAYEAPKLTRYVCRQQKIKDTGKYKMNKLLNFGT